MDIAQLESLPKAELIQKLIEFERALSEFQESSRELEIALEQELKIVEEENEHLHEDVTRLSNEKNQLEQENHKLSATIIAYEISADEYQLNERLTKEELHRNTEVSNTYLEKIAILDNDYELLKDENLILQRRIQELEKELVKAKRRSYYFNSTLSSVSDGFEENDIEDNETETNETTLESVKDDEEDTGNGTIISIGEALRSAPPFFKSISNRNLSIHLNPNSNPNSSYNLNPNKRRSLSGRKQNLSFSYH
ncbi:uncharacterized protein RJT21DRAFT_122860, partial [Scheffersomyces amazonensis]|uniref:uncharacterized protein n=1 Tax=Scheffersomyces amazonensis TaxID=1078765 RepID=UPI00315D79BF